MLLNQFKEYIAKHKLFQQKDRLLLAVSGGVDSVVLCELCHQAGYDFVIAHCNFQLRGEESERDEAFVKALGEKYGVKVFMKRFETEKISKQEKKSIETIARELRYDWFDELISKEDKAAYVLTAHHADDNIETVVMNFFRGTGIAGIRGILPKQGKLLRPLLFATKVELEAFAKDKGLLFVIDSTNLGSEYTRNFFRNKILPQVKEVYPEAMKNVLQNISRFADAEKLYDESIAVHKKKLVEQKGSEFHIPVLKLLKTDPLKTVLYEIIKEFGFSSQQANDAVALLKSDTGKYIQSPTHRIIKNRNWLIITSLSAENAQNILIEKDDKTVVFEKGKLEINTLEAADHKMQAATTIAQLDAAHIHFPLLLRKWKQGDYFYPLGMQKKKKKVSRFLIDQKLSLPQKENTWVLEMNKKIIWVVGMRIDDRFKITPSTTNIVRFEFKASL